jgi:poly(3-hydroxybutyrate) depolymerase
MNGTYWTVVPEDYAGTAPVPLVLWLSSGRGDADQQYPGVRPYLDGIDELFVVVGKLSDGGGWDTEALGTLLDQLEADYCVDPRRIHVMGSSSSAFPTSRLACEAADRIASVRVAMGGFPMSGCDLERPVPLLAITGDADRFGVRSSAKEWAEAYGCEAEPVVEELGAGASRRSYRGCDADIEILDIEGIPHVFVFHECIGPAASSGLCRENAEVDELEDSLAFFAEHPLPE